MSGITSVSTKCIIDYLHGRFYGKYFKFVPLLVNACYTVWNAYWTCRTENKERRMVSFLETDVLESNPNFSSSGVTIELSETSKYCFVISFQIMLACLIGTIEEQKFSA